MILHLNNVYLLYLESAQFDKELCDLYPHFQSAYFAEVEGQQARKGKMSMKKVELTTAKADLGGRER